MFFFVNRWFSFNVPTINLNQIANYSTMLTQVNGRTLKHFCFLQNHKFLHFFVLPETAPCEVLFFFFFPVKLTFCCWRKSPLKRIEWIALINDWDVLQLFFFFFQDVCSIINLVLKMWKKKIKRFNSWMITKSQKCNKCFFTQIWTKNKLARQRASYQTEFTDSLKATIQECQMRKTFFEFKK